MLKLCPLSVTSANRYVKQWHRHHRPTVSGLFALGAMVGDAVVGVAVCGRPVSRQLDDGWTVEVNRVATDGTRNACSFLYGACRRSAFVLGYWRIITYTLPEEGGASLRACGWERVGETAGGAWVRTDGAARSNTHPLGNKWRWECTHGDAPEQVHPSRVPPEPPEAMPLFNSVTAPATPAPPPQAP